MEFTTYYGMDYNPFTKEISSNSLFESNDYLQMKNRINFLIENRGIGLFMGDPGMGKTSSLRSVIYSLDKSRYKIIYICMTTITPLDFYKTLNDALGLEDNSRKAVLFKQIQEEIAKLYKDHINVIIVIDEVQFLSKKVLQEFTMLMNFAFDSEDYCTLILVGQPIIEKTLRAKALEPFRQRINIHYTLTGFTVDEVKKYVEDRLELVHCSKEIFTPESYHTLHSLMQGSTRVLNAIITKSLIIGMNHECRPINTDVIMEANEEARV